MNVIQNCSKFLISPVTKTLRAVTLEADGELKRSATKDDSDRSNGEANYEELELLFQLSAPPTTSLITEQQVSGMSEESGISDSFSEELGFRCESSKRMYSLPALDFSECVLREQLNSYQLQFPSMAEEVTGLKYYAEVVVAVSKRNGDRLMHRGIQKKRGSDEKEQEKKGQMYAERVLNLTEFGDRRTDRLER